MRTRGTRPEYSRTKTKHLPGLARHHLTGILTEYPVGDGCYDIAVARGQFEPTKPHHGTPAHVARFSPATTQQLHVRDGLSDRAPSGHTQPRSDRPLWLIEVAVLASQTEVDQLTDDMVATICPDPDHDGDCPTPWALTAIDGASLSSRRQAEIRESIRLTNPNPDNNQGPSAG